MKKMDWILVVDVESTCWEKDPPPGEVSEIIEVGVCKVDIPTLDVGPAEGMLVSPTMSKVSPFCTQLTTLTQEQVNNHMTFIGACHVLKKEWETREHVWASYGDYDRSQFERQCARTSVPYPFGRTHVNVKALLALVAGWPQEVGMDEALKRVNLPLVGTHHRAIDDARNIAGLLSLVLEAGRISFKHVEGLGSSIKEVA